MKIAILGFGTVGSGVYEILSEQASAYTSRFEVKTILIREGKKKTLPIMVDDIHAILERDDIEAVVEVIGGIEPAHTYIKQCLKHHKHVVTANKAVVAKYLLEFEELAKQNAVSFAFEASTAGGIPWIKAIEQVKRIDSIKELHGIFNGTSNFILDHMYKDNEDFQDILKKAQQLGYAEADPSNDIDGIDIRNKLQISASQAFESYVDEHFPVFGIRNIKKTDIEFFKEKGLVLKLMASAKAVLSGYTCCVEPCLFPTSCLEANVPENFNLASIYGKTIGELKFYGQGAGKLPTANAIIQDLIDIIEHTTRNHRLNKQLPYLADTEKKEYWLKTRLKEEKLKKLFSNNSYLKETYQDQIYYWIQTITTDDMHQIMQKIRLEDPQATLAAREVTHA